MAQVYLSLGSNIERESYIRAALDALEAHFGKVSVSSVYESEAVGFEGSHFYNLVVGLQTDLPVGVLNAQIKQIEDANGRRRDEPRFSARTLDIDILTYDDLCGEIEGVQLPRDEIVKNAFVLWPLAEVAGEALHPVLKQPYAELWKQYDKASQKLWVVPFNRTV